MVFREHSAFIARITRHAYVLSANKQKSSCSFQVVRMYFRLGFKTSVLQDSCGIYVILIHSTCKHCNEPEESFKWLRGKLSSWEAIGFYRRTLFVFNQLHSFSCGT